MLTLEQQIQELNTPVQKQYIKTDPNVEGPYTTGDYVKWKLNQVFGPNNWSNMVIKGPDLVTLNDQRAYVEAVVRLVVTFADGSISTHDDVGVWPLQAARSAGNLRDTSPKFYETVLKATVTDGLKACSEALGLCFRPLGDSDLDKIVKNGASSQTSDPQPSTPSRPTTPIQGANGNGNGNKPPVTTPNIPQDQPPVSATAYYSAATGDKYQLPRTAAVEIAQLMGVNVRSTKSDFRPAVLALPFFYECSLKGMVLEKSKQILQDSGMDIEKAMERVDVPF